jgi:hypothetical protein
MLGRSDLVQATGLLLEVGLREELLDLLAEVVKEDAVEPVDA